MWKRCFAALLAFAGSTAASPGSLPYYPQVHQVICAVGRGSAVRIGDGQYVSVNHVTSLGKCTIEGEPIKIAQTSEEMDFTILNTAVRGTPLKIDCDGFKPGDYYYATGFGHGWPIQTTILLRATAFRGWHGFVILYGPQTVIPGQSGGAILNARTGAMTGLVNAYNPILGLSFSRPLSDTPLCKRTSLAITKPLASQQNKG